MLISYHYWDHDRRFLDLMSHLLLMLDNWLGALVHVQLLLSVGVAWLGSGIVIILFLQLLDLSKRHCRLLWVVINSFVLFIIGLDGANEDVFLTVIHYYLLGVKASRLLLSGVTLEVCVLGLNLSNLHWILSKLM